MGACVDCQIRTPVVAFHAVTTAPLVKIRPSESTGEPMIPSVQLTALHTVAPVSLRSAKTPSVPTQPT